MELSVVEVFSLLSSIASLVLAIVAIQMAKSSEQASRANFDKTQELMSQQYERTKDVLAEIDKRAAVVERTVSEAQTQMLGTLTRIINETIIPQRPDAGEEFAMVMMQKLMQDPDAADKIMGSIMPLIEHGQRVQEAERQRLPDSNQKDS